MKTVRTIATVEEPDNYMHFRLIVDGELLEESQLSNVAGDWDGSVPNASLWVWGPSTAKLSEERLTDLARFFHRVVIHLPESEKALDDWDFATIEMSLAPNQEYTEVTFPVGYDLEFWARPYSIASLATALEEELHKDSEQNFDYWQRDVNTSIDGFGISVQARNSTTVGELLAVSEKLPMLREVVDRRVSETALRGVLTVFEFPSAVKTACEQYLLYFVQFLRDLGIDATAELKEEANRVLFSVTPKDEKLALEQIRRALSLYLQIPSTPDFAAAASQFADPAVYQLQSNVLHLQSQVVLARAVLQMKDATILAQTEQIAALNDRLDLRNFVPVIRQIPVADSEPVVPGLISVKRHSFKFVEVDFPELLRRLKRRFGMD